MYRLLTEIIGGVWLIRKQTADGLLPWVSGILEGKQIEFPLNGERKPDSVLTVSFINNDEDYQVKEMEYRRGQVPENSIVVIPIIGIISKYDQACGPLGTRTRIQEMEAYDQDPNVVAMILRIDSPGGEGYAAMAMAEAIQSMNKPVIAYVDDLAASAAYIIASAADRIYANAERAEIGSIGTYVLLADYREQWKKQGIKIHEIYAKASTEKNQEYREAIDGKPEALRERVSFFNDGVLNSVGLFRGDRLKEDIDKWGKGKIFFAKESKQIGLIDEIMPFKQAVDDIIKNII